MRKYPDLSLAIPSKNDTIVSLEVLAQLFYGTVCSNSFEIYYMH